MAEQVVTREDAEASFRLSLEEVVVVLEKIAPHCQSVEDAIEMLNLALNNSGQLRLLMGRIIPRSKK